MVEAQNGNPDMHPVVDVPTSLVIRIGKSREMAGFLSKLIDDVRALQEDIEKVEKGSKFRFKLEVQFPKGAVEVRHSIDRNFNSKMIMECEGGNGGGD